MFIPGEEEALARRHLEEIFRAALEAVRPRQLLRSRLRVRRGELQVRSDDALRVPLGLFERILVIGAGKATASMAQGLEEVLGARIDGGLIVVKDGHTAPLARIETVEAGHPVPDRRGLAGAQRIVDLCRGADERTLVICLVSGGGSALLPLPYGEGPGPVLKLEHEQSVSETLLACGAAIREINCVRKHISGIKGGRLAAFIHPATTLNLILSDVVGDRLDTIASGLTVADGTTYAEALEVVKRYRLEGALPAEVVETLRRGAAGEIPETPKAGDPAFSRVHNVLLGTNHAGLSAAAARARKLGYRTLTLSSRITGEAREVARVLAAMALEVRRRAIPIAAPACILGGGETTVTLKGGGRGGRNQELALAFLAELAEGEELAGSIHFLSAATDGNDGPTDAAGAHASLEVLRLARERGLKPREYLAANDSYRFFDPLGALLRTGPTNTNVCDYQICLVR